MHPRRPVCRLAIKAKLVEDDLLEDLYIETFLLVEHTCRQGFGSVANHHGHFSLSNDPSVIVLLVDEMDCNPSCRLTGSEDRHVDMPTVEPLSTILWQQGGMDI